MDDAELVRQVLQGNLGAYVDLVNRYTAQVAALCRAHIRRSDVVEDLVQETFLRGLDRLATLREPESFGFWLYAIARNLCRDWLNDPNRQHLGLDAASSEPAASAPGDDDAHAKRIVELRKCVDHLPAELREIVKLYYAGGRITYQELAERQGVSFGQVNKWLTHARKRLKACLERKGIDG
jgi:RNA polymerase sigma-70 factor (ECF subfamily)